MQLPMCAVPEGPLELTEFVGAQRAACQSCLLEWNGPLYKRLEDACLHAYVSASWHGIVRFDDYLVRFFVVASIFYQY